MAEEFESIPCWRSNPDTLKDSPKGGEWRPFSRPSQEDIDTLS